MKTAFNLKNFLTENRNQVIESYNKTAQSEFFSGVTMKEFGSELVMLLELNNVKTEKRAKEFLWRILEQLNSKYTQIGVIFNRDVHTAKKYSNTVYAQNLAL